VRRSRLRLVLWLALCPACLLIWVASSFYIVSASVPLGTKSGFSFRLLPAIVSIGIDAKPTEHRWLFSFEPLDMPVNIEALQLRYGFGHLSGSQSNAFYFPMWLPTWVSFALGAWAVLRYRRANRPGACTVCGYDLRATTDRCPECGTPCENSAGAL
jgi:hypothetical protein